MSLSLTADDIEGAKQRFARNQARENPGANPDDQGTPGLLSGGTSATSLHSGGSAVGKRRQSGDSADSASPSDAAQAPPAKQPKAQAQPPAGKRRATRQAVPTGSPPQAATPASALGAEPIFLFNDDHAAKILAMPKDRLNSLAEKLGISLDNPTASNVRVAILRFTGKSAYTIYDKSKNTFTFTGLEKQDFAKPTAPAQA